MSINMPFLDLDGNFVSVFKKKKNMLKVRNFTKQYTITKNHPVALPQLSDELKRSSPMTVLPIFCRPCHGRHQKINQIGNTSPSTTLLQQLMVTCERNILCMTALNAVVGRLASQAKKLIAWKKDSFRNTKLSTHFLCVCDRSYLLHASLT